MNISLDVTKKYALAVSGGVDSMVLLHLFVTHKPNVNFFVVTVNHNLREEAQKDCDFVKSQCQKYGIDCVCHQVDCLGYAQENKVSIETAGRILRKQIFENLPCDLVATAHHKDDNPVPPEQCRKHFDASFAWQWLDRCKWHQRRFALCSSLVALYQRGNFVFCKRNGNQMGARPIQF